MSPPLPDPNLFIDNTNRLLPEMLEKYPWEHVAWSVDGTKILAHSKSLEDLYSQVGEFGMDDYVVAYLAPEDELPTEGIKQHDFASAAATEDAE